MSNNLGAAMTRTQLREVLEELEVWLSSETPGFVELVARLLASLPGGEELEDMGYEPFPVGWKEAELLGKLLLTLQDSGDVAEAVRVLFGGEGEEES
jgi:hypothetical protein